MRKALVVSVQKNKKLEHENKSLDSRMRQADEKKREATHMLD